MNKAELKLLELAFAAQLPPGKIRLIQPRPSKTLRSLVDRDYLTPATVTLPGRFPVTVTGYELTLLGHMAYCHSCADVEEP